MNGTTFFPLIPLIEKVSAMDKKQFRCVDCPIAQDIERRLKIAEDMNCEFQFDHCYCDKIGEEFFIGGYCEDAWEDEANYPYPFYHDYDRLYRRHIAKKKLRSQQNKARQRYSFRIYEDIDRTHIMRKHRSNRSRYYKRYFNKKVRRYTGQILNGNFFKRAFNENYYAEW